MAVVLVLYTVASVGQVNATTYYVDYATGSDAANGTSTATPWKHCAGDTKATGNAASATIAAGDVIRFKGGVSYVLTADYSSTAGAVNTLVISGTLGSRITYDGNSDGTWGTGRAIITDNCGTNLITAFGAAYQQGITNVNFTSFEFYHIGGSLTNAPSTNGYSASRPLHSNEGNGIRATAAAVNVLITNCYFHELGYWTNCAPFDGATISGAGIDFPDAQNVTIANCEFTRLATPISIHVNTATTNLVIEGCNFHDYITWCTDIAVSATNSTLNDIFFRGNTVANFDKFYANGYWTGYGQGPHQDGFFVRASSITYFSATPGTFNCGTNINVYNNFFWSDATNGGGGTTCICPEGGVSMNVFNNVFANCNEANGAIKYETPVPQLHTLFRCVNNTFYQPLGGTCVVMAGLFVYDTKLLQNVPYWPTNNTFIIENNILSDPKGTSYFLVWSLTNLPWTQFQIDHNLYDYNKIGNIQGYVVVTPDITSMAQVRSKTPWETSGFIANPLFVDTSYGGGTLTYLNNLRLQTNSPAIGAGANLTALNLPGLNMDKDGNPRPAIGPWTLGAFSSIDLSVVPYVTLVASTNTIINGQSVTLTWTSLNTTNLILNGVGQVAPSGSMNVTPAQTTTFVMIAAGTNGTSSANTKVVVRPLPPPGIPIATPVPK